MYPWIWRHLPGPMPLRLVLAALIVAVVVGVLFTVAFPALDARLDLNEVTVEP